MKKSDNLSDVANKSTAMDNIANAFSEATDINVNDDSTFVLGKKTDWFKIKFSSIWNYIKGKISSILGLSESNGVKAFVGNVTGNVTGDVIGNVTGNVTGNCSGSSGSCTGNSASASNLLYTKKIDGVNFDGSVDIMHYGTCSSGASSAEKKVSMGNANSVFNLVIGARISVKFTYGNSAVNPTLNVESTGAKRILLQDNVPISTNDVAGRLWLANELVSFVYDGSYWFLDKPINISGNAKTSDQWGTARTFKIQDNDGTNTESTGSSVNGSSNITLKLPATIKATLTGNADTATKLGTATKGSATKPIYLSSGSPTECNTYAGGTAVTLNGASKAASTASLYAPTGVGTSGQILKSNGSGAPSWADKFNITLLASQSNVSSISNPTKTVSTLENYKLLLFICHGRNYYHTFSSIIDRTFLGTSKDWLTAVYDNRNGCAGIKMESSTSFHFYVDSDNAFDLYLYGIS